MTTQQTQNETEPDYSNATPEQLKELEAKRDRAKLEYERLATECRDLRAALGLDNPEILTYVNRVFFELDQADDEFCLRYKANPGEAEKELKELALEVARFEAGGNK